MEGIEMATSKGYRSGWKKWIWVYVVAAVVVYGVIFLLLHSGGGGGGGGGGLYG
jgi:preprotein translocase subunit SecG